MSEKSKAAKAKRKEKVAEHISAQKQKVTEVKSKLKNAAAKKTGKDSNPNTVKQNRLELLITIVARSKAEYYLDLMQEFDVNMQFLAVAHGTANETMRTYLGLTDTEKTVIFSVIQENKIADALHTLETKFQTIRNGKGIAYTIPLTSVIGTLIYGFLSNNRMAVKENK